MICGGRTFFPKVTPPRPIFKNFYTGLGIWCCADLFIQLWMNILIINFVWMKSFGITKYNFIKIHKNIEVDYDCNTAAYGKLADNTA